MEHYAPSNIALIKYWGKRNQALHLPLNSSISLSLGEYGSYTSLEENAEDVFILNEEALPSSQSMSKKVFQFIDLWQSNRPRLCVRSRNTVPTAAGLASSASGFAALTLALNDFFNWNHNLTELSRRARQGSGSACRSFWRGFVKWEKGTREDGWDSHGVPLEALQWPDLCLAFLPLNQKLKSVSSRDGMQHTVASSPLHRVWAAQAEADLIALEEALQQRNIQGVGEIMEANALMMHATMLAARPALFYWEAETLKQWHRVQDLRAAGLKVYMTADAGPNIKLLYLQEDEALIRQHFPESVVVKPFQA